MPFKSSKARREYAAQWRAKHPDYMKKYGRTYYVARKNKRPLSAKILAMAVKPLVFRLP